MTNENRSFAPKFRAEKRELELKKKGNALEAELEYEKLSPFQKTVRKIFSG